MASYAFYYDNDISIYILIMTTLLLTSTLLFYYEFEISIYMRTHRTQNVTKNKTSSFHLLLPSKMQIFIPVKILKFINVFSSVSIHGGSRIAKSFLCITIRFFTFSVAEQLAKNQFWLGLVKKSDNWYWSDGSDFSYTKFLPMPSVDEKTEMCISGSLSGWKLEESSVKVLSFLRFGVDYKYKNLYINVLQLPMKVELGIAEQICLARDSSLVWITSEAEQKFLNGELNL
ncbi:unnamed protein product [Enterobius vermicularis]|uniref:C-type lectin domain-containing protein n=1 Tax=Enterobius vermicularis TaxID=51028 RepID=A0A0N4UV02_ENTVE|nr:unnamed protein product [Enterobius vermicularis]